VACSGSESTLPKSLKPLTELNPTPEDNTAAYLSGHLTEEEAAAFERSLATASAEERQAFAAMQDAAAGVVMAATPRRKAPAAARAAILAQVAAPEEEPVFTYHMQNGDWETVWPGARIKRLFTTSEGVLRSFLLELDPGNEVPDHPHAGYEECMVIRGDLVNDGVTLGPGEYVRARPGPVHHGLYTVGGCLCMIVLTA
jgi:anti-sigma factor ChrR (cupin superfamily)